MSVYEPITMDLDRDSSTRLCPLMARHELDLSLSPTDKVAQAGVDDRHRLITPVPHPFTTSPD